MGSFLDKPKTDKTNDSSNGNGLSCGVSAMQGWRIEMEDSHCSKIGLPIKGMEDWSFFAVFDGHAGGTVSKHSAIELLNSILDADKELFSELVALYESHKQQSSESDSKSNISLSSNLTSSAVASTISTMATAAANAVSSAASRDSSSSPTPNTPKHLNEGGNASSRPNSAAAAVSSSPSNNVKSNENNTNTSSSCNGTDGSESKISTTNNQNNVNSTTKLSSSSSSSSSSSFPDITKYQARLYEAMRKGFLNLDESIRKMPDFDRGEDKSGSTAVACLVSPSHVYLINCGDSRSIMCSDNQVSLSTADHKPTNPNERERILNAGGSVMIQRVNGSLAVSRALGDYEYKCVEGRGPCEQLVSPEPEIYECVRSYEKDEFVVLACDGIWDVMSNEELKDYVHARLKVTDDLVKICNEVLDMCLNKGSRDNMSIIIVTFPGSPKVTTEHVEKDKKCNERLENKIKELVDSNSPNRIELSHIIHSISEEKWEDFPPGGGLYAKQSLIEEYYNKYSPKL